MRSERDVLERALAELPEMMTMAEVADALRCSVRTVMRMCSDGTLPCCTFGQRRKLIAKESVLDYLCSN